MCLQVFENNNQGQYEKLKPYAKSLGSAFQKINFLRDLNEDYKTLNRIYFPNLNINDFNNEEKKKIEKDIEKDFTNGLIGIKLLEKEARKGVYLAYKYYTTLFQKIKNKDANSIIKNRIRISNIRKIIILISTQFSFKLQ